VFYFQGTGGTGAPPLAMITEPSPCATATVFKLIAPTNANIASKMTESLRDICASIVENNFGGILYLCTPMSSSSQCELVFYRYTVLSLMLSLGIRLATGWVTVPIAPSIVLSTGESNSTTVLTSLVPSGYPFVVLSPHEDVSFVQRTPSAPVLVSSRLHSPRQRTLMFARANKSPSRNALTQLTATP